MSYINRNFPGYAKDKKDGRHKRRPSQMSTKRGKFLSHMKYLSKRSVFLRFYAYLCHVIEEFACLELQH